MYIFILVSRIEFGGERTHSHGKWTHSLTSDAASPRGRCHGHTAQLCCSCRPSPPLLTADHTAGLAGLRHRGAIERNCANDPPRLALNSDPDLTTCTIELQAFAQRLATKVIALDRLTNVIRCNRRRHNPLQQLMRCKYERDGSQDAVAHVQRREKKDQHERFERT